MIFLMKIVISNLIIHYIKLLYIGYIRINLGLLQNHFSFNILFMFSIYKTQIMKVTIAKLNPNLLLIFFAIKNLSNFHRIYVKYN